MKEFTCFSLLRLKNEDHYTFVRDFVGYLENAGFTAPSLVKGLEQMKACYDEETRCIKITRMSDQTALIREADRQRDKCYSWLYSLARVWSRTDLKKAKSGEKVMKVLRDYRLDVNVNYRAETGIISSMTERLMQGEFKYAVDEIGATDILDRLIEQNEEVERLMRMRTSEQSALPKGALKAARLNSNAAYAHLTGLIQSFCYVADDAEPYERFVNLWNSYIADMRSRLKRQATFRQKALQADEPQPAPPSPTEPAP